MLLVMSTRLAHQRGVECGSMTLRSVKIGTTVAAKARSGDSLEGGMAAYEVTLPKVRCGISCHPISSGLRGYNVGAQRAGTYDRRHFITFFQVGTSIYEAADTSSACPPSVNAVLF